MYLLCYLSFFFFKSPFKKFTCHAFSNPEKYLLISHCAFLVILYSVFINHNVLPNLVRWVNCGFSNFSFQGKKSVYLGWPEDGTCSDLAAWSLFFKAVSIVKLSLFLFILSAEGYLFYWRGSKVALVRDRVGPFQILEAPARTRRHSRFSQVLLCHCKDANTCKGN